MEEITMSRQANKVKPVRITITTSEPVKAYLESLVSLGAHGNTVSEAVAHLVLDAMRRDMSKTRTSTLNPPVT